ncbi:MAG: GspH/FimT family pseudopilin [Rubrivivax sp.]
MKRSPLPRRRPAGFSLTESMAALAVSLVALGSAVPGFETARERRQLEGVAAQLETDLQLARSEAVALNRTVRIAFDADAAGACYIVHTGGAQQCRCGASGPECAADVAVLRHVRVAAAGGVTLSANVRSMVFAPLEGTVTPTATMRVAGGNGREIRQIINIMGRVRSCSPGARVGGLPAC